MAKNLLKEAWANLDSHELRLFLDERIGGPGQYDGGPDDLNKLYLPLAGPSCRIVLRFNDNKIVSVERGQAFNLAEWNKICEGIELSILTGPQKIGREYSFSSYRILGSWRGYRSGVQILPPPDDAPRADVEVAEHPFILEFLMTKSNSWQITNHRRLRKHRELMLLLNVLLAGRSSVPPRQLNHCWGYIRRDDGQIECKWVQQSYFANLGDPIIDAMSSSLGEKLIELEPEEYYSRVGHDGQGLRVPTDLDDSICLYEHLSSTNRAKFDRAAFWLDMASRQWAISFSSSFASLVSAIESLTDRGTTHQLYCEECKAECQHDAPGATELFRRFVEKYAPGAALRPRRTKMYLLRSKILHGDKLMQFDQYLDFGWDPPGWNELELHRELWGLTRIAMRNWLKASS